MTDLATIRAALGDRWPVVEGPGWMLVHGNCLQVLAAFPDKCVRVTATDPPYEVEAHTLQRRVKRGFDPITAEDRVAVEALTFDPITAEDRVAVEALTFDPITAEDRVAVAVLIARVTEYRVLAFCQAEAVAAWRDAFNDAGLPYRRAIPWIKPDAMPSLHGRYPGQSFESLVLAQFPSAPACPMGGAARSYIVNKAIGGVANPHPTTKPLELMRRILVDFTDAEDLVLDCYAGSSTTGVACIRLGRRFIGIERDPAYFEIACRRMRGDEAKPRAEQPSLFDQRSA